MKNRFSTSRLGVVIMVLGATSLSPVLLPAQHGSSRFFVRVAGGANYFPFQEWGDFFGKVANSRYLHTPISLSPAISIGLRLAANHSLSLEVEALTSTSSLPGYQLQTDETGNILGVLSVDVVNWTFSALPITLKYQYHLPGRSSIWRPYLGIGLSYYSTKVEVEKVWLYDPLNLQSAFPSLDARLETGLGWIVMAGFDIPLSGTLYLGHQLRYRWADISAFNNPNDISISFTGFDFSVGISWNP
ncbi:MAG: outer membrane beta-barrel protein [Candidatus Marinimicrobia bacterium]|nr:outer membrane beta-barrel protein [Candidatus Neomarinimicrobiota bacterium]